MSFLMLVPVLVFGVWLVDFSGNAGLASAQMSAAASRGADEAVALLADPPDRPSLDTLQLAARQLATGIVDAAAIGICDTISQRYGATVQIVDADPNPPAVIVRVACPLRVAPGFKDIVNVVAISKRATRIPRAASP